ncbi:MAG: hypothetical protein ACYDC8_16165 [Gammaproteobacteria bacterium]
MQHDSCRSDWRPQIRDWQRTRIQRKMQRKMHVVFLVLMIGSEESYKEIEKYYCKTERFDAIFTGENVVEVKRPQTRAEFSTPEFPIDDTERSE